MNTEVDTSVEAVEAAWEEYEISAKPCGNDGDMEFFHVDSMTDEAYNLYTIAKALVAERDALRAQLAAADVKLRMVVSHATMGSTQYTGQSVNDISVAITANRNMIYNDGVQKAKTAREAALREATEACEYLSDKERILALPKETK